MKSFFPSKLGQSKLIFDLMGFFAPKKFVRCKENLKILSPKDSGNIGRRRMLQCIMGVQPLERVPKLVAGLDDVYVIDRDHIIKFNWMFSLHILSGLKT